MSHRAACAPSRRERTRPCPALALTSNSLPDRAGRARLAPQDGEAKRLQELTLNSRAAIRSLSEKLKKTETILKLAELNRKMETEREKVGRQAWRDGHLPPPPFPSTPPC